MPRPCVPFLSTFLACVTCLTGAPSACPAPPAGGVERAAGGTAGKPNAREMRAEFRVVHASCYQCLKEIETSLKRAGGVRSVTLSFAPPFQACVVFDGSSTRPDSFLADMRKRGYDVEGLVVAAKDAPRKVSDPSSEYRRLMNMGKTVPGE